MNSESKLEEFELRRNISTTLLDQAACDKTLGGNALGSNITQIKNSSNVALYETGKAYGNNTIVINSMKTVDLNQNFSDGSKMINLVLEIKKIKKLSNQTTVNVSIAIRAKVDATNIITTCFADRDAILQQACLNAGGTWNGASCSLNQFVLKAGDRMTGDLNGTNINLTGNLNSSKICTNSICKQIDELALSNKVCPQGFVQAGVKVDGTPTCLALQCPNNLYFAGLDNSNNPICRPYPTKSCPTNEYVSSVNTDGTVNCSIIPNNTNSICPAGKVLQSIVAGVPTCVNLGANQSCPTGMVVSGINANGSVNCVNKMPNIYCPSGSYLKYINSGVAYCASGTKLYRCQRSYTTNTCNNARSVTLIASGTNCWCSWGRGGGWAGWAPWSSDPETLNLNDNSTSNRVYVNGNQCVSDYISCYVAGSLVQ